MHRWNNAQRLGAVVIATCVLGAGFIWATHRHYVAPRTSPSFSDRPKSPALVEAAGDGDLAKIKVLLDSGVSPNAGMDFKEAEGGSALSEAAASGQLEAVKLLLARGADINADDYWGRNALLAASVSGKVEVVKFLLAHGADPNAQDDGVTALDYVNGMPDHPEDIATERKDLEIATMLRAAGGHRSLLNVAISLFHH